MEQFRLKEYEPIIRMAIKDNGRFRLYPRGTSMLPFLREGKDSVVLKEPDGKCKKYDVILYQRPNGSYVLHRIIRVENGTYTLCGDHQCTPEPRITQSQVIAVVDSWYRGYRHKQINSLTYQLYLLIWCKSLTVRRGCFFLNRRTKKLIKKSKV